MPRFMLEVFQDDGYDGTHVSSRWKGWSRYALHARDLIHSHNATIPPRQTKPPTSPAHRVFIFPQVTTRDPKALPLISKLYKPQRYLRVKHFLGAESILFQDGERAKRDRTLLNKAFGTADFRRAYPIMQAAARRLLDAMIDSELNYGFVSPDEVLPKATFDVIAEAGFDHNPQGQVGYGKHKATYKDLAVLLERGMNPLTFLPGGVTLVQFLNRRLIKSVDKLLGDIVQERLKNSGNHHDDDDATMSAEENEPDDLLQLMVNATKDDTLADGLDKKKWLADQVKLFMFAGADTTARTLHYMLALLALNPSAQVKIQEEIDAMCMGSGEGPPTFEETYLLKYIDCVAKETLRLYPIAGSLSRVFPPGMTAEVLGVPLPPQSSIRFDIAAMQRNPKIFINPLEFSPQRWMAPTEEMNESFAPFSFGFRACIGRHFSMLEMKAFIVTLFRAHRIVPFDESQPMPDGYLSKGLIGPTVPFRLRFLNRWE